MGWEVPPQTYACVLRAPPRSQSRCSTRGRFASGKVPTPACVFFTFPLFVILAILAFLAFLAFLVFLVFLLFLVAPLAFKSKFRLLTRFGGRPGPDTSKVPAAGTRYAFMDAPRAFPVRIRARTSPSKNASSDPSSSSSEPLSL